MTISSDIIRGYNDTIILSTLLSEDSYGYEISQTISEISEGKYQIKETTLYSCINRLLKNGYIESYRLDDISMPGIELIESIAEIFDVHGIETEIIAASVRNPIHVIDCARAGADIATVPYNVLMQMINHPLTTQGIEKFKKDYIAVFGE